MLWRGLRLHCVRYVVAANYSIEEGYHTLGKFKCYGVAYILIYTVQQV